MDKKVLLIKPRVVTIVFAMIIALFALIGYSFSLNYTFDFLLGNQKMSNGQIACIYIRTFILYTGIVFLLERIINVSFYLLSNRKIKPQKQHRVWTFFDSHVFLISMSCIALMWLPYFIIYFPGSVPADGLHMIKDAIGVTSLSNHHSWVLVEVFGFLYRLGSGISQNAGIFLVVCICGIIECMCYSYVIYTIRKWGCNRVLCIVMLLFYAVTPGFGTYAQAFLKDGLFYSFFSLLVLFIMDIVRDDNEKVDKKYFFKMIKLVMTGIVLAVIRRDAMVRIVVGMLVMIVVVKKKKKMYGLIALICILHIYSAIGMLADSISVEQGRNREPLSIPFQQTARYLAEYPSELSDEEYSAIAGVLNVDVIAKLYNPELSDPVKETYNEAADNAQVKAYIKAWLTGMRKHPRLYLEATLSNCFAYLYPFYRYDGMKAYQTYIKEDALFPDTLNYEYVMSDKVRDNMQKYVDFWRTAPFIGLIMSSGTYTWVLLLCQCYLIYTHRKKEALVLFAIGVNILIFVGSPVNGLLRYTMAVIACVPQMLAWSGRGCVADINVDKSATICYTQK